MEPTAWQQMNGWITGYWISQALYVAAKLELAELVADEPQTAAQLAERTASNADAMYRLLRALASIEVFAEDETGRFSLTPYAELLRADHPESVRAMALVMGEEQYHVWGDLWYTVQTGKGAFRAMFHMPIFEYLSRNPEKGKVFDAAMTSIHGRETQPMIDAYDFSQFRMLVDIGGGNATVLSQVLKQNERLQGVLFDLPQVVERAERRIREAGLEQRCRCEAGDFFESVPSGADVYLLRHIIHDWDDEKAVRILSNCRAAMAESGRVLVVESVVPPGNTPAPVKWLDLVMMVVPEGRERTEEQYRQLLADAGLRLQRIVDTTAQVAVLEAVAQ